MVIVIDWVYFTLQKLAYKNHEKNSFYYHNTQISKKLGIFFEI